MKTPDNSGIVVQGMEITLLDDAILEMTDIVVKGTNIQMVDEMEYHDEKVDATVFIFSFEVIESYFGEYEAGDEIFMSYGGTVLPEGINSNTNMILFLKKNILNYNNSDVYSFVSVSQGIYLEKSKTLEKASDSIQMVNRLGKVFNMEEVQKKYEKK